MKHEILLEEACTAEKFLSYLYHQYPYDIEEKMVFSLLEKDPYPHPALLNFIDYYAAFPKYRIGDEHHEQLDPLCAAMSRLYQSNKSALHLHAFQFDADVHIRSYKITSPYAHLCLNKIPFLSGIHLHTLPILSMDQPYIPTEIVKSDSFLYKNISIDADDFIAVSIRISDMHGIVYVPKTQMGIAIAICMIYENVPPATDADFILLYGLAAQEETYAYYFDSTNGIYIGLIAGQQYHHFQYVMQMITVLYNAICIEKKDLPIQACMLNIHRDDGDKGIVIIADEQSGKSELCDALRMCCDQMHISCDCIFENCGILHFLDNDISATGIQIGACVSIFGLPKERILQMLPFCALLKHRDEVTHILFPFTSWKETCRFHKVHACFYLSRHKMEKSYRMIHQLSEAQQLFLKERVPYEDAMQELIHQFLTVMMINDIPIHELSMPHLRKKKYLQQFIQLCMQIKDG